MKKLPETKEINGMTLTLGRDSVAISPYGKPGDDYNHFLEQQPAGPARESHALRAWALATREAADSLESIAGALELHGAKSVIAGGSSLTIYLKKKGCLDAYVAAGCCPGYEHSVGTKTDEDRAWEAAEGNCPHDT